MSRVSLSRAQHIALERTAGVFGPRLWKAFNLGWPSGLPLEPGEVPGLPRATNATNGMILHTETLRLEASGRQIEQRFSITVHSQTYRDCFILLPEWAKDAVCAYIARDAVAVHTKAEFEFPNPERKDLLAPLFLAPPDLQHPSYGIQLAAFVCLVRLLVQSGYVEIELPVLVLPALAD